MTSPCDMIHARFVVNNQAMSPVLDVVHVYVLSKTTASIQFQNVEQIIVFFECLECSGFNQDVVGVI